MIRDAITLVFSNFRHRQKRSLLTIVGIFIGIAAVVSLISLGQGMNDAISKQFATVGGDKIIVQAKSSGFGPPGSLSAGQVTTKDLDAIKREQGVEIAAGRLLKVATVEFNNHQQSQFLTTLPNDQTANLIIEANNYKPGIGRLIRPADQGKIMIGEGLSEKTLFGKSIQTGNKILINGQQFEVAGILSRLGDPARNKAIVMNENDARILLHLPEEYSVLVAKASSGTDPRELSNRLKKTLRREREEKEGRETFDIQTSDQLIQTFTTILNIVISVVVGISMISLLVGGVGITNTMYTSVVERTREIGIMKAIGATNQHILTIFILEAGILGIAGGIVGILIGIILSKTVEYEAAQAFGPSLLQASFPLPLVVGALGFSFVVGCIAGIIPALRASHLSPVEALREE